MDTETVKTDVDAVAEAAKIILPTQAETIETVKNVTDNIADVIKNTPQIGVQPKWKSIVMWFGIAGCLTPLITMLTSGQVINVAEVYTLVLSAAVAIFGAVNNPSSSTSL